MPVKQRETVIDLTEAPFAIAYHVQRLAIDSTTILTFL